jgi:hypothetical protein
MSRKLLDRSKGIQNSSSLIQAQSAAGDFMSAIDTCKRRVEEGKMYVREAAPILWDLYEATGDHDGARPSVEWLTAYFGTSSTHCPDWEVIASEFLVIW